MEWVKLPTEESLRSEVERGRLRTDHWMAVAEDPRDDELARALASLALDGGQLIIGAAQDGDADSPRLPPAPQSLHGWPQRIERVARELIDPPLRASAAITRSDSDRDMGWLLVNVHPSPHAPHRAAGNHYGRDDSTERVLPADEVAAHRAQRLLAGKAASAIFPRTAVNGDVKDAYSQTWPMDLDDATGALAYMDPALLVRLEERIGAPLGPNSDRLVRKAAAEWVNSHMFGGFLFRGAGSVSQALLLADIIEVAPAADRADFSLWDMSRAYRDHPGTARAGQDDQQLRAFAFIHLAVAPAPDDEREALRSLLHSRPEHLATAIAITGALGIRTPAQIIAALEAGNPSLASGAL